MVESAPQSALLRTGETAPDANTTECLGYGDGGNWRWRQLQQREKLSKTEVGSPSLTLLELFAGSRGLSRRRCSGRRNSTTEIVTRRHWVVVSFAQHRVGQGTWLRLTGIKPAKATHGATNQELGGTVVDCNL